MSSRVPCKNVDCSNTILPDTAERNDGLCMPCVGAAAQKEREAYIRENRKDVNLFKGLTDPVEIIEIVHKPRNFDPLVNWIPCETPTDELYASLSGEQQQRLVSFVCELLESDRENEAEDIIRCLSAFTEADLERCLSIIVAEYLFWPSMAFKNASEGIRDNLIQLVDSYATGRNLILCALAWIGDSVVVDLFRKWRDDPPEWASSLNIAPFEYSQEAGWELSKDGSRRDLYFLECFQLLNQPTADSLTFEALSTSSDSCPWCNSKLTDLVSIDLVKLGFVERDAALSKASVTTCEICTAFGTIYGVMDENFCGGWAPENKKPDYLPDDTDNWGMMPTNPLALGARRLTFAGADSLLPTSFSQIGGHPGWVQDSEYPTCPKCSQTMLFLAQISNEDIDDSAEGIFYSFICLECKTTATGYQQT